MDDLSDREKEYACLALFAAPNAPLVGTLFWEFGGHVQKICDHYKGGRFIQLEANLIACAGYQDLMAAFSKMHEPPAKPAGFLRRLFRR
jgi:hypothetical protein